MEVIVRKHTGENTTRKAKLEDSIFGVEPKDHAIYLDVKQYLANQRQGTHKAKEKGEITGSTRKLRKQKGSGNARVGSIKSPIFRGGGRIFGPRPRSYGFKLNKKTKVLAKLSALSYKAKSNNVIILEDFDFDTPKTKTYSTMLNKLGLDNSKSLFVFDQVKSNIVLSGRNIPKTKVVTSDILNTYDILYANNVVFSESALKALNDKINS